MRRSHRFVSLAVLIALAGALGGCAGGMGSFDPTDMLDFLDTKKKLPGERKPVFPGGVPGLEPGVPRELYKGAQQQPDTPPPQAAAPVEPPPRGSRRAARPAATPSAVQIAPADANVGEEGEPAAVSAPPPSAKPKVTRRRTTAPPPDPEPAPARQQQAAPPAQGGSAFPAPLPSGSFSR